MSAFIPGTCKLYMLQLDKSSMNLLTDLENYFEFINDKGGLTNVGWYNRGVINYKIIVAYQKINNDNSRNNYSSYNTNEEDIQVESGEISCHVVSINPKNYELLYPNYQLGRDLGRLKFDVK